MLTVFVLTFVVASTWAQDMTANGSNFSNVSNTTKMLINFTNLTAEFTIKDVNVTENDLNIDQHSTNMHGSMWMSKHKYEPYKLEVGYITAMVENLV